MKRSSILAAAVLAVLVFALGLNAQFGMRSGPPPIHGVWSPVVSKGAIYETRTKDGGTKTMEISVTGKESAEGKDAYWLQMAFDSPDLGGQMVMKHLVVLDGQETHMARSIMQMPNHPPMEMPAQMTPKANSRQSADIKIEAQDLGPETITVPAGTFTSEHYRMKDGSGDTWVTNGVPPWGLVKHEGKDSSMVLVKVLTDARDKIVGKPVPFDPQSFMRQPPQQ